MLEQKIIIFAHPRSGSTSLFRAINAHPLVQIMLEPFYENRRKWGSTFVNYRDSISNIENLRTVLDDIYLNYNGFKTLVGQLPDEFHEYIFRSLKRSDKVILLHRKSLLQAVVSTHISRQTDTWAVLERIERLRDGETIRKDFAQKGINKIDPMSVRSMIKSFSRVKTRYKDFLTQRGQSFIEVTYEDLYIRPKNKQDIEKNVLDIFGYLGLEAPPQQRMNSILQLFQPYRKINNTETYALIPNAKEIENEFGGEENGHLF